MEQMKVNSFDDVLNSLVSDESDRGVLEGLVDKYPGIKDGWMRQSDYSRKLDTFRDTERKATEYEDKFKAISTQFEDVSTKYQEAQGNLGKWDQWVADNWDTAENVPKMEKYWRDRAAELEQKVGQDMTFDEINKYITDKGVLTRTDLDSVLSSKTEEVNKNFQGSAYFAAVIAEKQGEHISEFGKPLKVRDFVAKLNEYGTSDLDVAYDKYVAEGRQALAAKAKEQEIEQIRAEEREKAEKEFATRQLNHGLPVDQGEAGLGHLQSRVQKVGDPDAMEKATLGDNTLARLAAEAYRKEKLGVAQ